MMLLPGLVFEQIAASGDYSFVVPEFHRPHLVVVANPRAGQRVEDLAIDISLDGEVFSNLVGEQDFGNDEVGAIVYRDLPGKFFRVRMKGAATIGVGGSEVRDADSLKVLIQ